MGNIDTIPGAVRLVNELETARRWAVRLEGELARAKESVRSQEILRERADADRDTALGRLATCSSDAAAFRHQRDQARAERDEAVTALTALVAALDDEVGLDPEDECQARALVARYRRPVTATIKNHGTPK